ncbi:MAG: hypothetical protein EOP10_11665 [Proteobacteria bacterium]|nr:MAG: hypothetical protein EOP10_11665 [Pseudomonadota bacterium]
MVLRSAFPLLLAACALVSVSSRVYAKDEKTKVLDLNQVDMEEVDDNWENQSNVPKLNPTSGLKVKDIIEPTSEYTYASFGKPDPFTMSHSLRKIEAKIVENTPVEEQAPGSKEITVTSPLQAYPLSVLTVKGVWQTAEGEFRAVIITPKKEGIIIKIGDPISSGKVLGIERDNILVRLYKLRKDGVREYEDSRMSFGTGVKIAKTTIKLEPGKDAQFPGMDEPADTSPKTPPPAAPAAAAAPAGAAGTPGALPAGPLNAGPRNPNAAGAAVPPPTTGAAAAGAAGAGVGGAQVVPAAAALPPTNPDSSSTRPGASSR